MASTSQLSSSAATPSWTAPYKTAVPLTSGTAVTTSGEAFAVTASIAGTMTLLLADGTSTLTLAVGVTALTIYPLAVLKVTASGGLTGTFWNLNH